MKAIGFLGGSFDPIHNGHTLLARDVYEQMDLERVVFVPAYIAPHKMGQSFAPAQHRLRMTELAVAGSPFFEVSDWECAKGGISYTVDTMAEMKHRYKNRRLVFIVGADTIPQLETWHEADRLFSLVTFAAVYRPGYDEVIALAMDRLGSLAKKIQIIHSPEYMVSSTLVRQMLAEGKPLTGMVAAEVEEYITEHGLYR